MSKHFSHPEQRHRSLREWAARGPLRPALHPALARTRQAAPAPLFQIKGLELRVARGESIALVGANGCGKSTALRLIAGIYPPSSGTVQVRGRLTAVIELGSGLHSELTGLENIALYASLLGLGRRQIAALAPAAVEFAQLGDYIDVPLRYHSSGMRARLAFSIALCADPDILLLDEALAVGDAWFRDRCFARLHAFRARGGTLIAVSHDLETLRQLCSRAVWLAQGTVRMSGALASVIDAYSSWARAGASEQP